MPKINMFFVHPEGGTRCKRVFLYLKKNADNSEQRIVINHHQSQNLRLDVLTASARNSDK